MELQLRPSLFWDVNVKTIDLDKHQATVITRITTRGRLVEFKSMLKFYGEKVVKNALLNTRHLDKKTLAFCSVIFNVPKTKFRCYKLAQLNPEHWHY